MTEASIENGPEISVEAKIEKLEQDLLSLSEQQLSIVEQIESLSEEIDLLKAEVNPPVEDGVEVEQNDQSNIIESQPHTITHRTIFEGLGVEIDDDETIQDLNKITGYEGEWRRYEKEGEDHHNGRVFFFLGEEESPLRVVRFSPTKDEFREIDNITIQNMYFKERQDVEDGVYDQLLGQNNAYLDSWMNHHKTKKYGNVVVATKFALPLEEALELSMETQGDENTKVFGDEVIKQVASIMLSLIKAGHIPSDWGGSILKPDTYPHINWDTVRNGELDLPLKGIGIDVSQLEKAVVKPAVLAYDLDIPLTSTADTHHRIRFGSTLRRVGELVSGDNFDSTPTSIRSKDIQSDLEQSDYEDAMYVLEQIVK